MTHRPLHSVPVRPPDSAGSTTPAAAHVDALRTQDVTELVSSTGWPSVTVLMDTAIEASMSPIDSQRLSRLVQHAHEHLNDDGTAATVSRRLSGLARTASTEPTGRAIALFASLTMTKIVRLPNTVPAQVVIDNTFRTTEVVRLLHRVPPHLLLVLHTTSAQLYRAHADTLRPVPDREFPVQHTLPLLGALEAGDDQMETFIDRVDTALTRVRARRRAPIIVAGEPEPVRQLLRTSEHLDRLAGVIVGPEAGRLPALHGRSRLSIEEYLRSREDEAIDALLTAKTRSPDTVHAGLDSCWKAVAGSAPVMLVLEEGLTTPKPVITATDRSTVNDQSGSRADLVDDLVEKVIKRGGWVAFASDGRLAAHDRVALVTRD